MPIITGSITREGATIDLLIEPVEANRKRARPQFLTGPIPIRGVLDTGAALTGISRRLLLAMGLEVIDTKPVRTPVGPTQIAACYKLRSAFVSGGTRYAFAEAVVIAADCFEEQEEHQALIGRDVLDHCTFQYWGTARKFQFAY